MVPRGPPGKPKVDCIIPVSAPNRLTVNLYLHGNYSEKYSRRMVLLAFAQLVIYQELVVLFEQMRI